MIKAPLEPQQSFKNEGSKDHMGVPLLLVNGNRRPEDVLCAIRESDVTELPSPDKVVGLDMTGLVLIRSSGLVVIFYALPILILDIGQSWSWSSSAGHPQAHALSAVHIPTSTTANTNH